MHQINLELSDQLYKQAKRRAGEAGFKTVSEYIAGIVSDGLLKEDENLDHLFTPERLALIDKAEAQIQAGQCMTARDADVELARRRTEWLQSNRG